MESWLAQRNQARDLDWSAAESARCERPLFCAVTKAGRPTGVGLSDKAVARLVKGTALSTQVALAYLRPADLWRNNVTQGVFATKKDDAD